MKKTFKIIATIIIIFIIVVILIGIGIYSYQKYEESIMSQKAHQVFNQKGWEDKIRSEKNVFTFNTQKNDLKVIFKDEPYNTYTYSLDEDNKVYGNASLNGKYLDRYFDTGEKPKDFEEKYDLT